MESKQDETPQTDEARPTLLADFDLSSVPGNEYQAMRRVAETVAALGLPPDRQEKLKTAVAEAVMNAMEHGNRYRDSQPVHVQAECDSQRLVVRITDQGGGTDISAVTAPDMDQKLAGLQSPRGWGLFLIKSMVDETNRISDGQRHTLELILYYLQTGEVDGKG